MKRSIAFLTILAALAVPVAAQAHFLWAIAVPETKSFVVQFAEAPGDSVIPKLAGKGDAIRGWTRKGATLTLTPDGDGLKGSLNRGAAGIALDYGVLDKTAEGRGKFWLKYFAKAAASVSSSQRKVGLPLEVSVKEDAGNLVVYVTKDGKPASLADVVVRSQGVEKPFEGKTNAQGNLTLPGGTAFPVAIRTVVATNTPGKQGEASYDLVREYSSLTIQAK